MTIDEAIKDLDIIRFNPHWDELVKEEYWQELMEMSMNALKEAQKYQETGHTPAMVRDLIRGYKTEHKQNMKLVNELEDYQQIGTPEECRAAAEKQAEKKVLHNRTLKIYFCPICERKCNYMHSLYCSGCGQKLDWSDEQ